ncbi:hypothetical protein ACFWA9_11045 [Kitasatospora sp. NPDC059973]|uniref:hypothetical protein n=1 Tax=Kitasatospora sp. NPDC059973 TaxID=3347020 RepID=UPI0036C44CA6
MRKSVMPSFAKNVTATSGRRRLAAVAATVVLAGSVQLMTAEASWACGSGNTAAAEAKPVTPASAHQGTLGAGFFMTPDGQSITAGGAKAEIGLEVGNFTGAPYENVAPVIAIYNPEGSNRLEDFTVEAASEHSGWKKLTLRHGCDPTIIADTSSLKTKQLTDGHATHFAFRVSVSANAAADLKSFQVYLGGKADGYPIEQSGSHTYKVLRTPAPAKPATTAKPAAKPTTSAKPTAKPAAPKSAAPVAPVEDKTQTPATPKATPTASATTGPATTAPATTAPAGTPELAQTGAGTPNGFLAAASAAFVALGAGVLIAVRRLRPQR